MEDEANSEVGLRAPRVFISYAREPGSETPSEQVLQLWWFLRNHGIDARLDLAAAGQRQDWSLWTADEIREADFILIVASPAYRARAQGQSDPGVGRGVQWETRLIRDAFYTDQRDLNRWIPVVLPGQTVEGVPDFLAPSITTVYHVREFTVVGAEALLRLLTSQPRHELPRLGPRVILPPNSPQRVSADPPVIGEPTVLDGRLPGGAASGMSADALAAPGTAARAGKLVVGMSGRAGSHQDEELGAVSATARDDLRDGGEATGGWRPSRSSDDGAGTCPASAVPGMSIAVPTESGPAVVCGREDIVAAFVTTLTRQAHGRLHLLVGAGGMGKSTVARLVADNARQRIPARQVWWLSAANEEALSLARWSALPVNWAPAQPIRR